jgi:voltage-gated potassium channel
MVNKMSRKSDIDIFQSYPRWKKKLHRIIFGVDTRAGKNFDILLLLAIFCSVIFMMLESVKEINAVYQNLFFYGEWVFTILFTIEYILRLMTAIRPRKYALSFMGIIDVLAILPTFLSLFIVGTGSLMVIRSVRLIRVFRVFKLTHFMGGANQIANGLWNSRHKIIVFFGTVVCATTVMGAVMYVIEGPENGFTSIPRGIYWAMVTVTTVGYGDITPQTSLGQGLAACLMVLGYAIIAVPTGIITAEMAKSDSQLRKCQNCDAHITLPGSKYCHVCGFKLETDD